jgi:hypothetical protein
MEFSLFVRVVLDGSNFCDDFIEQVADAWITQLSVLSHLFETAAATDEFKDKLLVFRCEACKRRQGEMTIHVGFALVATQFLNAQHSFARGTSLRQFLGDVLHLMSRNEFLFAGNYSKIAGIVNII